MGRHHRVRALHLHGLHSLLTTIHRTEAVIVGTTTVMHIALHEFEDNLKHAEMEMVAVTAIVVSAD